MLVIQPVKTINEIIPLYEKSFPEEERMGIYDLIAPHMNGEILGIYFDDFFIGFIILFTFCEITHILYFAIDEKYQNKGIGSQVLQWLKEYKNKNRILADLEKPVICDNLDQRYSRIQFYEKNGFQKSSIQYNWKNEFYCIYSWNGDVQEHEFSKFWKHYGQKKK